MSTRKLPDLSQEQYRKLLARMAHHHRSPRIGKWRCGKKSRSTALFVVCGPMADPLWSTISNTPEAAWAHVAHLQAEHWAYHVMPIRIQMPYQGAIGPHDLRNSTTQTTQHP